MPLWLLEQHRSKASWWPRALIFSLSLRFAGSCVSEKKLASARQKQVREIALEVYVPSWVVVGGWFVIVLRETVKIACVCGWCNLEMREWTVTRCRNVYQDTTVDLKIAFFICSLITWLCCFIYFCFSSVYWVAGFVLGGNGSHSGEYK